MSQGIAVSPETIDRVYELSRKLRRNFKGSRIPDVSAISRLTGLSRRTIQGIFKTRVETAKSAKEKPRSEGTKKSEKSLSGGVTLTDLETSQLPAALQRIAQGAKSFEFVRSVPAYQIDIYSADGVEVRRGNDEALKAYQDALNNQKVWYGRVYGGRR